MWWRVAGASSCSGGAAQRIGCAAPRAARIVYTLSRFVSLRGSFTSVSFLVVFFAIELTSLPDDSPLHSEPRNEVMMRSGRCAERVLKMKAALISVTREERDASETSARGHRAPLPQRQASIVAGSIAGSELLDAAKAILDEQCTTRPIDVHPGVVSDQARREGAAMDWTLSVV